MSAIHPELISDGASDFTRYRRNNSYLSVVSIISRRWMPSAFLASSRRVGSLHKLLLNDLKLGFDRVA